MRIINKQEFLAYKDMYLDKIGKGSLFVYPTDTIYGIGCNAMDDKAVKKIRAIKKRFFMPYSIIAPSKVWIRENCEVNPVVEQWLEKLPGQLTLILKLKELKFILLTLAISYVIQEYFCRI